MVVRIISSVVALPILIVLVLLGGFWLQLGLSVISIIGLYEFYKAVCGKIFPVHFFGFAMSLIYIFMLNFHFDVWFPMFINIFVVVIMSIQAIFHKKVNIQQVASIIFGFFYITFIFSNVYVIRCISVPFMNAGLCLVWLVFISAWCCDTGAYFTGMLFGKHKLAPELSPKKTIEGSVGGVIWAGIGGALYGVYINYGMLDAAQSFEEARINIILVFAVISAISSIFAQLGDLAASAVKRYTKIKDFGTIMPGHGGVIDRFDSVIFTSAAVYVLSQFIFGI